MFCLTVLLLSLLGVFSSAQLNTTTPSINSTTGSTHLKPKNTTSVPSTTTPPTSVVEGSHIGLLSANLTRISEEELQIIKDICQNGSCLNQSKESIQRRIVVMQIRLDALKRNVAYRLNPSLAQKAVNDSMALIFKAKQVYLQSFGIPNDLVMPADDGLFFGHVMLSDFQASQIVSGVPISVPMWPLVILYHISPNISNSTATHIENMIMELENQTCLRFVKKSKVFDYELSNVLFFEDMPSEANNMWCTLATLGHSSPSYIYINSNCTKELGPGEIIHSMMFVLGVVGHEINRLDREKSLMVQWDKIKPEVFDVYAKNEWKSVFGNHFDFSSVTNLRTTFGAKTEGEVTMRVKNETMDISNVGQRSKFSCTDLEIIKKLYCCPGCLDMQRNCGFLAANGLCHNNSNWFWMKSNCAKSCGYCCHNSCATRPDCVDNCFQLKCY